MKEKDSRYFEFQAKQHQAYRAALIKFEGTDPGPIGRHYKQGSQVIGGGPGRGGRVVRTGEVNCQRQDGSTLQENIENVVKEEIDSMNKELILDQKRMEFVLRGESPEEIGYRALALGMACGKHPMTPREVSRKYGAASEYKLKKYLAEWFAEEGTE